MAQKKRSGKKTVARKKKKTVARKKKSTAKRPSVRRAKTKGRKKATRRKKRAAAAGRGRARADFDVTTLPETRGLGPEAGGQAGDTEGLSRAELADSESVEELVEEGQAFEAGVISGVENAPEADRGGVRTRQVPEDDVPQEYLDED